MQHILPFWPCPLSPMTYQEVSLNKTNRLELNHSEWCLTKLTHINIIFIAELSGIESSGWQYAFTFPGWWYILKSVLIAVGHYIPLRKNLGIYLCQTHLAHCTTSCLVTYKRYSYIPNSNFHQLHSLGWRFSVSWLNSITAAQIFLTISIIKIHFQSQLSHGLSLLFSSLHCRLFFNFTDIIIKFCTIVLLNGLNLKSSEIFFVDNW